MEWEAVCAVFALWLLCKAFITQQYREQTWCSRCWLNPTVQTRFSPYSSKIRTWAAPLLSLFDWSRKSVIVLLLYYAHTPERWEGKDDPSLWSLCVYTEEQYVVIRQSWKGTLNPCASLYNSLFHLIIKGSQHASQVDLFALHILTNHNEGQSRAAYVTEPK